MNILGIVYFLFLSGYTIFAIRNLRWAVLILPAFFPLYLAKIDVAGIPLNLVEMMVYILALISLINAFVMRVYGKFFRFFNLRFLNFSAPAALLIFGTALGCYVSYLYGDFSLSLGILKGWVIMPILYASMLIFVIEDDRDRLLLLRSYMASCVGLSLWAFYQVSSGDFITIDGRASGPFESANYLALYIAPLVFALIARIWQAIRDGYFLPDFKKIYLVEVVALLVVLAALTFSMSYGGILGVFGALILFVLYEIFMSPHRKKYGRLWKRIAMPLIVLMLGGLVMLTQLPTGKFNDFLAFDRQSSSSVRLQVWQVAAHYITEEPLLGVGPGRFQILYENNASNILGIAPYESTMLHPHNLFLATWLNSGLLGMFALIWIFVGTYLGFKHGIFSKKEKDFSIVFLGMFGVVLLHGFFDQPFWKNDLALLWWIIVVPLLTTGFSSILGKIEKGEKIGTKIGYPTINIIVPKDENLEGVYVCGVEIEKGMDYFGTGYVGEKKGLKNNQYICEVHLFSDCGDVYGKTARVTLLKKIREVEKIENLKELKRFIDKDVLFSKKYLAFAKYAKYPT